MAMTTSLLDSHAQLTRCQVFERPASIGIGSGGGSGGSGVCLGRLVVCLGLLLLLLLLLLQLAPSSLDYIRVDHSLVNPT